MPRGANGGHPGMFQPRFDVRVLVGSVIVERQRLRDMGRLAIDTPQEAKTPGDDASTCTRRRPCGGDIERSE